MKIKILFWLFVGCLFSILLGTVGNAQTSPNLLNGLYYGFEAGGQGWNTSQTTNWTFDASKPATGSYSLKFSSQPQTLSSKDVNYTISKIRTAVKNGKSFIVASSYEGTIVGLRYDGKKIWENKLSGFMNHDLWCEDITGDGIDEIFAANANGTLYCLNNDGTLKWQFKQNDAPMYAVCVVSKNNIPYVVCGGYDKNIYYLNADGTLKQTLASATYSVNTTFGGATAPNRVHIANFIRKVKKADGSDILAVLGTNNSMQVTGNMYLFDVLGTTVITPSVKVSSGKPVGEMRVVTINGASKILMGNSAHINDSAFLEFDPLNASTAQQAYDISSISNKVGGFGYRVSQPEIIPNGTSYQYFILFGNHIILMSLGQTIANAEILECPYSFNDMWKDPLTGNIIFASSQSGGSDIHIIDPSKPDWKLAYKNISSPGKIQKILDNTAAVNAKMNSFVKPSWERNPISINLLYENTIGLNTTLYNTPTFVSQFSTSHAQDGATWDRANLANLKYRDTRDSRRTYDWTEAQALSFIYSKTTANGVAYWGGHGNDPYMFSKQTSQKVIDNTSSVAGRKTVLIYPELGDDSADFEFVLNDLFYPLATYGQNKNLKLFVRSKNIFWQSSIYLPMWSRLLSGEFANVFVPSMEETTDKTMELSLAARMGVWASGAVDSWGARAVPDNASFDRMRQFSDQSLDNHFLRQLVYAAASGAQYYDNFTKPELFAKLLANGALFVPKRNELVSLSPVHLSMFEPDAHYLEEGSEAKWLTNFDQTFEDANPFVFSRMNGSWPGAPINDWDFSKFAGGMKERRLNFLPNYPNGMVLITPPQAGAKADLTAPRGLMKNKLHPLYQNILKEYYTDGHFYYAADGVTKYNANTYYQTIKTEIEAGAAKIPITVTGDVAWVVAQTAPRHLRLTLVDNGYINPDTRMATVKFNTVSPVKVVDVVDGKQFFQTGSTVSIDVPCGMFRFIDVELTNDL
ncbi:PQQ-binding-like beta-propeller repeat protein [Flavobacterium ovatum]|uniref:outer membrane protein assembly factor BamB family protein n=1 Tax=Flavobacterium ovatum TaxID=1928857 RepID=UPI00344FC426